MLESQWCGTDPTCNNATPVWSVLSTRQHAALVGKGKRLTTAGKEMAQKAMDSSPGENVLADL